MNRKNDPTQHDRLIAGLVQSMHVDVPPELDKKVTAALTPLSFKPTPWLPVTAAAAALILLAAFFIFQPFSGSGSQEEMVKPISEIKTEIQIQDKNIKILWLQKRDFKLDYKQGV